MLHLIAPALCFAAFGLRNDAVSNATISSDSSITIETANSGQTPEVRVTIGADGNVNIGMDVIVNGVSFNALVDRVNRLEASISPPSPHSELQAPASLPREPPIPTPPPQEPPIPTLLLSNQRRTTIEAWGASPGLTSKCYDLERDGPNKVNFHTNCDARGASIVIMELGGSNCPSLSIDHTADMACDASHGPFSEDAVGRVIGGYISSAYRSATTGTYVGDSGAFLFSLAVATRPGDVDHKYSCGVVGQTTNFACSSYGTYIGSHYGPSWGAGSDLQIATDSWGNQDLQSSFGQPDMRTIKNPGLGHTFECRVGSEGTAECDNDLIPGISAWSVASAIVKLEVWVAPTA